MDIISCGVAPAFASRRAIKHAAFVKRSINHFGFKFRYPDERDDAAISQGALNVDEKIKELIEIGSFDYELFKFTLHGDESL